MTDNLQSDLATLRARVAELEQVQRAEYYGEVWALERNRAEQAEHRVAELEATIAELTTDGNAATLAANLAKASKRNAELVEQLKAYGKYAHDTTLEDQNAELVAALRLFSPERFHLFSESAADRVADAFAAREQAIARVESAAPAVIKESLTTESATPGLRTDNPMAEPVMGGLPRYDGEKLGTPAKHCEDCAPEFGCFDGGEPCYKQPLQSSTPAKHPDTVRLDWLAQTTNGVSFAFGSGKPIVSQGAAFPKFFGDDLRAAIDSAMKGGTP